jgi:hypothetical protein
VRIPIRVRHARLLERRRLEEFLAKRGVLVRHDTPDGIEWRRTPRLGRRRGPDATRLYDGPPFSDYAVAVMCLRKTFTFEGCKYRVAEIGDGPLQLAAIPL